MASKRFLTLNDNGSKAIVNMQVADPVITAKNAGSTTIPAGTFVAVLDVAGVRSCQPAEPMSELAATGFILTDVAAGADVEVYTSGQNSAVTGLTMGTRYFLADGGTLATAPLISPSALIQELGVAIGHSILDVDIEEPIYYPA